MTTRKKATKKGATQTTWSLTECAVSYLERLRTERKSESTIGAYSADLDLAVEVLGGETDIAKIDLDAVHRFNESTQVTTTKSGRPKADPTIQRSRRVLRLALQHAEREGVIEAAPIEPKKRAAKAEDAPTAEPTSTAKPKRAKRPPLSQREAIGNDDQREKPAAAEDDPAQISYASTGEPVSA